MNRLIPLPYRILALAILSAALVGFGWVMGADHVQGEWDKENLARAEADRRAEAKARAKENDWQEKWRGASNARTELEKRLEVARAAAIAADGRLRRATDDFQRRLSEASIETCRTAASTAAALLGDCSAAYRDLARAADGHVADVGQCEAAWPD